MNLVFAVTEEDIAHGKRGSPTKCPIANALRRKFPEAFDIRVACYEDCQSIGHYWSATIHSFKGRLSFDLPHELAAKASAFDTTGEMTPFVAEVTLL